MLEEQGTSFSFFKLHLDRFLCTHNSFTPSPFHATWCSFANAKLATLGYDVITIDGDVLRSTAREIIGQHVTLQGNYDPQELIAEGGNSITTVRATAKKMLNELGPQKLIANLGEGLGGKESPELVDAFVTAIHEESEALIGTLATA